MASLYTSLLYAIKGLAEGDTDEVLTSDGFRMVVTNIDCLSGPSAFTPALGFESTLRGETWFMAQTNGVLSTSVQWFGHQVFDVGDGFRVNAHRNAWDIRVTGWLLELP